ncbi:TolC family outer membrane protein [Thiothrix unzii]|uniref:TolC family outer membrane protein n=1 Tax=Thiothrix unzii TaxID=111769 RepID=A0A975F7D0_9GAMM|nr:TolC family outer membrane protein [Thiothrix unzii]QTR52602.1 TolC family outer membrane protein [Thiothrix unzii]
MSTVYDLALRNDPEFAAAEAAHRAGVEALPQARSVLLPQLGGTIGLNRTRRELETTAGDSLKEYNNKNTTLSLTQIIYDRKAFLALKQAAARVVQVDLEQAIAKQDLALRTAQAYAELSFATASLGLAQAKTLAFAEQQQQAQQMYDAGQATITDVHEARARHALATAEEMEALDTLHIRQQAMYKLTGQSLKEVAMLAEQAPMPAPQPNQLQHWLDKARNSSLEILAAGRNKEVAQYEVKRARSQHLPVLKLVGSGQWQDNTDLGYLRDNPSSVGVQLSVPIFEGGRVNSVTRETLARRDQANALLRGAALDSDIHVIEAFHGMNDSIARTHALEQAVHSGEVALDAAQGGFKAGLRTSLDVLNAHQQVFSARRDLLQARHNYILHRLKLEASCGTLERADLVLVDKWLNK